MTATSNDLHTVSNHRQIDSWLTVQQFAHLNNKENAEALPSLCDGNQLLTHTKACNVESLSMSLEISADKNARCIASGCRITWHQKQAGQRWRCIPHTCLHGVDGFDRLQHNWVYKKLATWESFPYHIVFMCCRNLSRQDCALHASGCRITWHQKQAGQRWGCILHTCLV